MELITLGIAIAGFFMSLASWIKDFITQRKHIEGKILDIKSYKSVTYCDFLIENRSRLPIAVTNIEMTLGLNSYPCSPLPTLVMEHTRSRKGEVYDRVMKYSTAMPIQIAGLGATTAGVLFEKMHQIPPDDTTHLTLSVSTNRGKPIEMKLELPAGWYARRTVL